MRREKDRQRRPENIAKIKDKDLLGRRTYNIISKAIEVMNISEEKKKQYRQAYLW